LVKLSCAPALALLVVALFALLGTRTEPAQAHHLCPNTGSPLGAFPFDTYEDANYRTTYARTFELAGLNQLFPELPSFALPAMETGPRAAGSSQLRSPYIPPALLKAIAWIEAGWAQADYSVPYGAVGPVLASHDCGYGLMQVTTGMQNVSGVPNVDQAMIGGHYAFNIARGARILVDKWNHMPEYRPVVGSRDPTLIEDWYFAVWAYNGFSFKNHPLNPSFNPARPSYSCGPLNDGLSHDRTQYPYQELVFGCMAHPPVIGGVPLWTPQEVHLPERSNPVFAGPLSTANWDACAYSLQCAAMDIPTPNPNHRDATVLGFTRAQIIGSPSLGLSAGSINMVLVPPSLGATASLTVSNAGTGVLSYRIISNASWLRISRLQGVALGANLGATTSTVQITADTSGLGPGRYTAQLTIESPLTAGAPATVTVTVDNYPNGTLLKGSGSAIYVMSGGVRRHIPNAFTFGARGYDWARIITVSDTFLASILLGNPLLNAAASGNLYMGSGSTVWVTEGGTRRAVASPAVMTACNYGWDAIRVIPDALLSALPVGPTLSASPCPALTLPDGSLIQGAGSTGLYVVKAGLKRHVPNVPTFNGLGLRWGDLDVLPASTAAAVPTGNPLVNLRATGILLSGSGTAVYVMENGTRRHIASVAVFTDCGYAWDAIYRTDDVSLDAVPAGPPVTGSPCPVYTPPEASVFTAGTTTIYVVRSGLKRPIPNIATFDARGFQWGNIDSIHPQYASSLPTGWPILDILYDGQLVKSTGTAVYVTQSGTKRHIYSASLLTGCGYSWDSIASLGDAISTIPLGSALTSPPCPHFSAPDGTLFMGSGSAVYVMDGGRRRHIANAAVMAACGYEWGNIDQLPDGLVESIPAGPTLSGAPCP
jgi:hypothetical protein